MSTEGDDDREREGEGEGEDDAEGERNEDLERIQRLLAEPNEPEDDDADPEESESDAEDEPKDDDAEDEPDADPDSIDAIETIRVDPDDVVSAIAYNGQEDLGKKGKAVFALIPPFEATVEPSLRHLAEDSTESKAEGEIHLRPFRFVAEGRRVVEQRPTRRLAKQKLDAEEPTEEELEAWVDEALETWKAHVRDNFVDSIDVFSPHGMALIDVEYGETA